MTIAPLEPTADDADLALAAARGDQIAFTAIYDRYADRLHDFCSGMLRDPDAAADCVQDVFVIAAGKLGQLEDRNRLRAWLYAIARHQALARIRDRRRERPSDDLPETDSGEPDLATVAARHELADLIDQAFGGLSDRDRTVYELAYRHGLAGPELADALGVSHTNANTLVGRLRDGIERSLGALLVCRRVKADPSACAGLAQLVVDWDGTFTVLMRKRVARHIDGCEVCDRRRRAMVSPAALLGAAPVLLPAPEWLRDHTLTAAAATLPETMVPAVQGAPGRRRHLRAALMAALALIGVGGVAAVTAPRDGGVEPVGTSTAPSTTPAPTLHIFEASTPSSATTQPSSATPSQQPPPVITTTVEPVPSAAPASPTRTTTRAPERATTTRTTPQNSFSPTRTAGARPSRTSAPRSSPTVTGTMTVDPIPADPTTTLPSDPIE